MIHYGRKELHEAHRDVIHVLQGPIYHVRPSQKISYPPLTTVLVVRHVPHHARSFVTHCPCVVPQGIPRNPICSTDRNRESQERRQ